MTKIVSSIAVMLTLAACGASTPEEQIVRDAAAALGGRTRIQAVKTLVIEGEGTNGNLGQDMTMEAAGQQFAVSSYKRAIDLVNRRSRTEQTRTPNFAYFQGPAPQKQVFGVDGEIGYNVAANGTATRVANSVARDRTTDIYHHPVAIVRAALQPDSKLANSRTAGDERVVDVTLADGRTFILAISSESHLPTRVVSMADNLNLGDVAIETTFADYDGTNGVQLPTRISTKTDKYATASFHATRQAVDSDTGDLSAPAAAASAPAVAVPPPATVKVEEVAKGIWFLGGQSHHSVLVEFADHLTLIEAPQNDVRALAVIAKARELRPEKPLTEVVNTHHHFDHSGGLRAAVSEGLTVITAKPNEAFVRDVAGRPHTIAPDALSKNPRPVKIVSVDEELTLKDQTMAVTLYHVKGSPHGDAILMAYFPRERVLVEVDVFSPGAAAQPYAANLLENIRSRNLRVDKIVPLHGVIVPFAELLKTERPS